MAPLTSTASQAASISLKPSFIPSLKPRYTRYNQLKVLRQLFVFCSDLRRLRDGKCKAEFSADSPVAVAIGVCILSSLIFPVAPSPEDVEAESLIDSADARFAVMGIISFIPYFNWMSWVFAWLDTGNRRYAVYALVYLAPYLRPNLSISPEESWLPIASILLCIAHIQLEASIKNGNLQGFQLFNEAAKRVSSLTRKKNDRIYEEDRKKGRLHNLSSASENFRNQIKGWNDPQKLVQDDEHSSEDEEYDE